MPPKQIPATAEVVDLDSSDEEGGGVPPANNRPSISVKLETEQFAMSATQAVSAANDAPAVNNLPLETRSFWKAGAYEIGPTKSTLMQGVCVLVLICCLRIYLIFLSYLTPIFLGFGV